MSQNIHTEAETNYKDDKRILARESYTDDWVKILLKRSERRVDIVLPLRLYKDLQVIAAGREMRSGNVEAALDHLKTAIRSCFELGDYEQGKRLQERVDAVQIDRANAIGKKDSYGQYLSTLQNEAGEAVKVGDMNRTRDLLRQLAVLSANMGDKRASKDYMNRVHSIETVYVPKGSRSITVQNVFRSRLVHTLRDATNCRELAFRETFADRASVLRPILV